jgi:hypothetical protein
MTSKEIEPAPMQRVVRIALMRTTSWLNYLFFTA